LSNYRAAGRSDAKPCERGSAIGRIESELYSRSIRCARNRARPSLRGQRKNNERQKTEEAGVSVGTKRHRSPVRDTMAVHGRGSVLIKFSNLILIKCVAHEVTRRKRGRLNLYSMDRAAADRAYL